MAGYIYGALMRGLDWRDGGRYCISGTLTREHVALSGPVRLFDRQTGRLLRQTTAAANGSYSFVGLAYRYRGYIALAHDQNATPLNAAIADLITPEPMP